MDQFYLSTRRHFCSEGRCNEKKVSYRRRLTNVLVRPSWDFNSTRFAKPIYINATNPQNSDDKSWILLEEEMHHTFRGCLSYYHMYNDKEGDDELNIKIRCMLKDSTDCQFDVVYSNQTKNIQVTIEKFNQTCSNKEQCLGTVHVNLLCTVLGKSGNHLKGYGINQPIIVAFDVPFDVPRIQTFDSSTDADLMSSGPSTKSQYSAIPPKAAGVTNPLIGVLVLLVLAVSISLIIYKWNQSKKEEISVKQAVTALELTSQVPSYLIDNPDYSSSDSGNEVEDESVIPKWLSKRKDMIYDKSCVKLTGRKLGHGNFGAVQEGRVQLGNAV